MPDRLLRDELLTSERYWSVSPEARNLFLSLVLSVDDTARYTGANFALRTKCMAGTVSHERIEKLLLELVDVDLVRLYQSDGQRYILIPRSRQRLRYTNSRYPSPPIEINDITIEKTDSSPSQDSPKPAEVKRREELPLPKRKRSGVKKQSETKPNGIETWTAYSTAYRERYGVEPVRNAQVNAIITRLCSRVSHAEAPAIAAFYVRHDQQGYVRAKHPVSLLLRDAEGLRTEWATNRPVTETDARNVDKRGTQRKVWTDLIEESNGKPKP